MNITDLHGQVLTVTDIEKAIRQAALFKTLQHEGKRTDEVKQADAERQQYWADLHEKLLQLQLEITTR